MGNVYSFLRLSSLMFRRSDDFYVRSIYAGGGGGGGG
jgi:hypothetical protein